MPLKRSKQRIYEIKPRYIETRFSLVAPGDPNNPKSTAAYIVSYNLRADAATRTLQNHTASTIHLNEIDGQYHSILESSQKEAKMKACAALRHQATF